MGASIPIFAIIFGEFYGIMSLPDPVATQYQVDVLSIYFVILGILAGVATFLQTFMFNVTGVRLTYRLRENVFASVIRQDMGWFDSPKNSVGALSARLSGDCAAVQGVE